MEVKLVSDPTRSEVGHDVERSVGAFASHYITPLSVWRAGDHRFCADRCRYGVCHCVREVWDQVGHPCQTMREPGQGMNTEE